MEDQNGIPFTGPGGEVTKLEFQKIGIPEDDIFFTNVLACKPYKWLTVRQTFVEHCWDRLDAEQRIVQPKMIIAMGTPAAKRYLQKLPKKGEVRGKYFNYKGTPGLTILHPAALNRHQKDAKQLRRVKREVKDDFERILELYQKVTV
jgi:DNA polymerase